MVVERGKKDTEGRERKKKKKKGGKKKKTCKKELDSLRLWSVFQFTNRPLLHFFLNY
jgi:hypothetical protein